MDDEIKTSAEAEEAAALPRCREVHTDPERPHAAVDAPASVRDKPVEDKSPAQWAYERLILYIQNFEKTLNSEQEVAMGFTGGGATGILRIEGMGYFDPDIVTFYGSDPAGGRTQLVQHVTQLNVMLRAVPKPEPQAEATRIGFRLAAGLDEV